LSPDEEAANSRKGRIAWKISSAEAASEEASMRVLRSARAEGLRVGRKSRVWEPTSSPETEAEVAVAR